MLFLLINLISLITGADSLGANPSAELLFVGDAMQHQAQLEKAREIGRGNYDYSECFTLLAPEIQKADYAVCNLEVPLGGPGSYSGYPCFSAPDSFAQALIDAGFDMMLTANNHCLDKSDRGVRRTLNALDSLRIDHIGTYRTRAERDSLVPLMRDINGFKIAFLNYTYGTNGIEPRDGAEISLIDKEKISKEINRAKELGAEIIVATMHWGIEYVLTENKVQRNLTDFLVDAGVDVIIGGHPHVIQPMKVIRNDKENKDVLVVYSLGNFISNMKTADTRGGAMVWVKLCRDDQGKARFDSADYDIFFSAKPENGSNFKVVPAWLTDSLSPLQQQHWNIFKRGALNIFDKYNEGVPRRSHSTK